MTHYDYTIIGAGCSGLSLAIQLAKNYPHKKILLLESREKYVADRTWCYWDVEENPFHNLAQNRWSKWQVRCRGKKVSVDSKRYTYCCIHSDSFYSEACGQIENLKNVTFLMNSSVVSLRETPEKVFVHTQEGQCTSSLVYDSRPEKVNCSLYQHFIGWKVHTERPVFNSDEVVLMDFDVDQSDGLHFIYLLPYSSTTALVESTFMSDKLLPKKIYEKAISSYLKNRYSVEQFTVLQTEGGILPLGALPKNQHSPKIIPIGASAGWMRASTGYAFLAIQRATEQLITGTSRGSRTFVDRYLDQVFLSYIQQHPDMAPQLFFNLFDKNDEECLVRFLTSSWSCNDLLKIVLSMPKMAMLKQVFT